MGVYPILHIDYSEIDDQLNRWAKIRRLSIDNEYQEVEVRSIRFFGENGIYYQLWVNPPNDAGLVEINVWDYKKRRIEIVSNKAELFDNLELAYTSIRKAD